MIIIRTASERGHTQSEWLDSYHTFSFGSYHDPEYLGFGNLLVINEDMVKPQSGFGLHSHQNMEIITYVISGEIKHEDSLGDTTLLKSGEIQRMSAGTGIRHSEINPSNENLHFLQIWILPRKNNLPPSYEQNKISTEKNILTLIGSSDGRENTVTINQDVDLYKAHVASKNSIAYSFDEDHYGWIQLIKGSVVVNEVVLNSGDGAAIIEEDKITIEALEDAEFLFFDFLKQKGEAIFD